MIDGQMSVDECIRLAEIELLASTQNPVSECVATCECVADCEVAGMCLLTLRPSVRRELYPDVA